MGVDAEVSAFDDGERIILDAHGAESGLVIGKKGATLDALQYLVNRIVFKQPGERPLVVVDAEGYRGRREDSLVDLAKRLAEKAQRSGKPVPVEPMSPHDRRIVHMALVDHPGVTTESEGEGPARRVVIFPKKREIQAQSRSLAAAVSARSVAAQPRRARPARRGRRPRRRGSGAAGGGRRHRAHARDGGDQLGVALLAGGAAGRRRPGRCPAGEVGGGGARPRTGRCG